MNKIRPFQTFKNDKWNDIVFKLGGDFNYTSHFLNYQNVLFKKNLIQNLSFIIFDEFENPLCLSVVFIEFFHKKTQISIGGNTIPFPLVYSELNDKKKKNILNIVFEYFDRIIKSNNVKNIKIRTPLLKQIIDLNFYQVFLENILYKPLKPEIDWLTLKSDEYAIVNLTNNNLKIRSSFKSCINQTIKKNCELIIIDKDNFKHDNFLLYSNFHNENKINQRTDEIFNENLKLIKSNKQVIFMCKYNHEILGSITVNYFNQTAFYQSSVNKFLLNYKIYPNHFLLHHSFEYLKKIKIKIFNLGEVVSKFSHQNNFTNKEKNISFFKMGFCSDIYISKKYEKKYD
jgi:hypothetical protein